jgi:2-C-methyl-D-erythritol 4-phosphate cytidylyltransferase
MRLMNFGNEPDTTLLSSEEVANISLQTLLSDFTGQVIDIKLRKTNC